MFIITSFVRAPNWKQPQSIGEWIKDCWYIHIMEYLTINRNKLFINATTWMTLKTIMLMERSQAKRKKIHDILFQFYKIFENINYL